MEILTELRLRQWARKNYVAASERNDNEWHPVVLSEMRRRDSEVHRLHAGRSSIITSSGILQLERSQHEIRFDQAQRGIRAPKFHDRSQAITAQKATLPLPFVNTIEASQLRHSG